MARSVLYPIHREQFRFFTTSLFKGMPKKIDKYRQKDRKPSPCVASERGGDINVVYKNKDNTVTVRVLAKPGSKQNAVSDISEEGVGIQIAAPPVDGEANSELVKFVSKTLGLRKSDVVLDRGSRSRNKSLRVTGIDAETVLDLLRSNIKT